MVSKLGWLEFVKFALYNGFRSAYLNSIDNCCFSFILLLGPDSAIHLT